MQIIPVVLIESEQLAIKNAANTGGHHSEQSTQRQSHGHQIHGGELQSSRVQRPPNPQPHTTMNRLQAEQRRLYLVPDTTNEGEALIDAQGQVRAMVVDVAQQAGWDAVAALCQGIQDELDLPTPAIAVSGGAGFQVWLSLAEPVSVLHAQAFLAALCQRFLSTRSRAPCSMHARG